MLGRKGEGWGQFIVQNIYSKVILEANSNNNNNNNNKRRSRINESLYSRHLTLKEKAKYVYRELKNKIK